MNNSWVKEISGERIVDLRLFLCISLSLRGLRSNSGEDGDQRDDVRRIDEL